MVEKEKTFEFLVDEALDNVRADREMILDAYEKMKSALDAEEREKTVMMGPTAAKLLEQLTKVNEQIVKLAQIKERQESAGKEKKSDSRTPLDIDEIKKFVEGNNLQDN